MITGMCENCLNEALLICTHNLCFEQKKEEYHYFYSEKCHFASVIVNGNGKVQLNLF